MHKDMEKQLNGYGLTTAQILYHLPDHPAILQTYVWQDYDLAPDFPEMRTEGRVHPALIGWSVVPNRANGSGRIMLHCIIP
jgi:hypothetical protein